MKIELFDWRTDGFRYGSTEECAELSEGQKKPWTAKPFRVCFRGAAT